MGMRKIIIVLWCLGAIWIGVVSWCLIKEERIQPSSMRITGWNCNDLIYEDLYNRTYKLDENGNYILIGNMDYLKGDKK